uniref:NADH dehydrogenase subunit 2 n=1 Tax=Monomastix sp. (strain OKE-1) TaxID=141716 RepID=U5YDR1_MONSK|nr:NADH dehydrogenase subunit 2 [Monomastix sp. OKE-1]AGZ90219.1 NADH dehydrogenase subunit 2 [Monomastix sp. OKE-1]
MKTQDYLFSQHVNSAEDAFATSFFKNDFLALFPEIFLIMCTLFLLMYGVHYSTVENKVENNLFRPILTENVGYLSLLTLGCTFILLFNNPLNQREIFFGSLILDDFTLFFKGLLLLSCIFVVMISFDFLKKESLNAFEYHILILLSTCSMLFMISSYDFLSLYLALEFQSLCFYVLAACKRNSEFSTEAGLKYFLLGAFSSGILLFGISLIYGFTGITNFEELTLLCASVDINHPAGILLGMLFIAVGLLFKLTAAPFHMWAPDVYEGAPTSVTAYFSVAPKIALLALFIRLFYYAGPFGALGTGIENGSAPLEQILVLCSIASMFIGAFSALSQQKIKRLFAYSSIGHIGYMFIGLIAANREGLESVIVYLIIYIMMTLNVFALLLSLRAKSTSLISENNENIIKNESTQLRYISDLSLLSKTNPMLAFTLTITLFSMAGIPPLAGFCGKFYVFFSALSSSFFILAFVGIFTSVISCFYYIRLIKIMYFEKESTTGYQPINSFEPIDKTKSIVLGITFFFTLFFLFYPAPLFLVAHKVALSLLF